MKKKQTLESLITSCTENACIAVQLMASYSLPYRFYTDFLLSIDLMLSKISSAYIHPVGNINHSLNAVKPLLIACHEAFRCFFREEKKIASLNEITEEPRKFMVALDMGKADADVDRQVICVTSIDENGYPKEQIVSAAAIYN